MTIPLLGGNNLKKILIVLLALLTLTGCGKDAPAPTGVTTTQGTTAPPIPLYDPDSHVEDVTGGAVRAYPLEGYDAKGFAFLGGNPVLFAMNGQLEMTTLHLLEGEDLSVTKSLTLDCALYPEDTCLQVTDRALAYYSPADNSIVILDAQLEETKRIPLPEQMTGAPLISTDLSTLYYCIGTDIRAMDLTNGISRLLKQQLCTRQELTALYADNTILEVFVTDEEGIGKATFISTADGQTLGSDGSLLSLSMADKQYLVRRMDGSVVETLVGTADGQLLQLAIHSDDMLSALWPINAVLAGSHRYLELYDLGTGEIISRVSLDSDMAVYSAQADPSGSCIWLWGYDSTLNCNLIFRWDHRATEVVESYSYLVPRYSAQNPDTDGLARCRKQADEISTKYGITLWLGLDIPSHSEYQLIPEYQAEALEEGLQMLDEALSAYPEGFFRQIGTLSRSKTLHISLMRSLQNLSGAPVPDQTGLQFRLNDEYHIALALNPELDTSLHHQMAHVLDSYVMGRNTLFDTWDRLTPGFTYFQSYTHVPPAKDDPLLGWDTRAFITGHGMTYPREDRAEIFSWAMTSYCEDLFKAPVLQAKLRQYCLGLRTALGLKKDASAVLPWEQYLLEPIV